MKINKQVTNKTGDALAKELERTGELGLRFHLSSFGILGSRRLSCNLGGKILGNSKILPEKFDPDVRRAHHPAREAKRFAVCNPPEVL